MWLGWNRHRSGPHSALATSFTVRVSHGRSTNTVVLPVSPSASRPAFEGQKALCTLPLHPNARTHHHHSAVLTSVCVGAADLAILDGEEEEDEGDGVG
jgi:hypothetical protein